MGSVDESYQLLAARYVRKQSRILTEQLEGARKGEDVECVHQSRVASRRLRSALRMFRDCFPGKKVRKWRKQIRRVTSGLGDARDTDVQIEFVHQFLANETDPARRTGIDRLLLRLRQRRQSLQPKVVKALGRLAASGTLKDMRATTKAILSDLRDRQVTVQSPFVFLRAERLILRKLEKLLAYQDCLSDPTDKPRHHEMRIVTKRLRYTLEICRPVYDGPLDDAVMAAKQLQELLGDIHDCDAWVETLPAFLVAERARTLDFCGSAEPLEQVRIGIEHMQQERQRHRDETFLELTSLWQQLTDRGLWDGIVQTVLSRVRQPAEAPEEYDAVAEAPQAPAAEPPRDESPGNAPEPADVLQPEPKPAAAEEPPEDDTPEHAAQPPADELPPTPTDEPPRDESPNIAAPLPTAMVEPGPAATYPE